MKKVAKLLMGLQALRSGIQITRESFREIRGPGLSGGELPTVKQIKAGPPQNRGPQGRIMQVQSIDQRVKHIVMLAAKGRRDPRIRAFTVKVVSKRCGPNFCLKDGDHLGQIRAVHEELKKHYRYVYDAYGVDTFQSATRTLEFGGGDCDDASILVASCLGSIGYPCKMRVVHTKGHQTWNHIYVVVGLPPNNPKQWVPIDLSVRDKPTGWQVPTHMVIRFKDYPIP